MFLHTGMRPFSRPAIDQIVNALNLEKPVNIRHCGSPEDLPHSRNNTFNEGSLVNNITFHFTLTKDARILHFYNKTDLVGLSRYREDDSTSDYPGILDFEKLSEEYDAILYDTHKDVELDDAHRGWDCKCI